MTENQDLPHGWAATTLGGALPIEYGKGLTRSSRSETGRIPVYGSSGQVGWHSQSLTAGPTLILGRKGSVGAVHYSPQACWPIDTTYYTEGSAAVSLKFALYLLRYAQLGRYDKSTTIPGLSRDDYNSLPVSVPPIAEQHRIVAAIEEQFTRLDAGVAALERVRANLKRYRAAVLKAAVEGRLTEEWRAQHPDMEPAEALLQRILDERRRRWEEAELAKYAKAGKTPPKGWQGKYKEPTASTELDLPLLPGSWVWASVDEVSQIQGGIQKQPSRTPKDNFYPYLRVANVLRGRLDLRDIACMELFNDELSALRLQVGDLLVVEGNGSPSEIGRSALWNGEIDDCVHQNHIIRVRIQGAKPDWVHLYWNSPQGRARVNRVAASTSGLYTLSIGKISRLPLPLPPLAEQDQIVLEVEQQLSILEKVEAQVDADLKRATRLRQAILQRAFEGKLVPQDPTDKPASVLLERIRRERETGQNGRGRNRTARDGQKMQMRLVDAD